MASIQKRTRKGTYYAFFRDAEGKRACKCTETADRAQAMALALKWERAASEAARGVLTVGKARQVLNEMLSLTGQAVDQESLKEYAERWIEGKKRLKAARTAERYEPIIKRFVSAIGSKATQPLSNIAPADIERHRDNLTTTGKSALSVRLELKTLSGMFNQAQRQGLIQTNPVSSVEMDEATGSVKEPFTPEEVGKLLAASQGTPWHGAILIAALTGLRLGDATSLRWENLKLEPEGEETLTILPQKTQRRGKTLTIPLHSAIPAYLAELGLPEDAAAFVFPTLVKRTGGAQGLSSRFAKLMKSAGIERKLTKAAGLGRRVSNKSFHSLRHYTATELLNAGVDESLRMKLVGHATAAMNRRYSHATVSSLRGAVDKLKVHSGSPQGGAD